MHNQKEEELKIKCWAESTSSLAKYNGIVCIFDANKNCQFYL